MENSPQIHKFRKVFELYFAKEVQIDIDQMLQQPEDQLTVFIKDNIVPVVSSYPPKLRKELETLKFLKPQTYKQILKEIRKPSRSASQQKLQDLKRLAEMNPKIVAPKLAERL